MNEIHEFDCGKSFNNTCMHAQLMLRVKLEMRRAYSGKEEVNVNTKGNGMHKSEWIGEINTTSSAVF